MARAVAASTVPVVSAVGHETDFTICDFVADRRAPTPSAAAELAVPDVRELAAAIQVLRSRMQQAAVNRLPAAQKAVADLAQSPVLSKPEGLYRVQPMRLLSASERLFHLTKERVTAEKGRFREAAAKLDMLNPLAVLLRGYGVVYDEDKRVVSSVKSLKPGNEFSVRLCDGTVRGRAERILPYDKVDK